MEELLTTVRRTLADKIVLPREIPVVVAVSGGADSVALLACLCELGYVCVAAHCNFHLRGDESMRDMRFVEALTERLGVDLYVRDFNVPEAMAATGESLEMACRRLRYEWFDELLTTLRAGDVAVGHHREDNVETFFLNLARGSGIAGLTGMSYRRDHVIRPLLDCSRAQIEEYLNKRGLDYVVDSTNLELDCRRNCLRNSLLPELERLLPGALAGVERSMRMLADARGVFDRAVQEAATRYGSPAEGRIDIAAAATEPDARVLLFELLHPAGFSMAQVEDMLADPVRSGVMFRSATGLHGELSRGVLEIYEDTADPETEFPVSLDSDITEPLHISITHHDSCAGFHPEASRTVAYLDDKALAAGEPWVLRRWRRGDRLRPFGMRGSRLLSDIFSDAKMTVRQKRSVWLLCRGDEIVWAIGVRASSHYPVTSRSRGYLELRLV